MQDVLASFFQHAAMTAGVTVRVAVNFMPDQSRTEARRWFWVYHIRIENHRDDTIQLRTRHWRITDSRGMVNFVEGEGCGRRNPRPRPGADARLCLGLRADDQPRFDGRALHVRV
jgi:ApaG protein